MKENKTTYTTIGLGFTILGLTIFRETSWIKFVCLFLGAALTITSFVLYLKSKK